MNQGTPIDVTAARRVAMRTAHVLRLQRSELLTDVEQLASLDSPSGDHEALRRTADWLEDYFAAIGVVRRLGAGGEAPTLIVEVGDVEGHRTPLALCHYDTVWPRGTASRWAPMVRDGWMHGPGVLDMKGSIVVLRHALASLVRGQDRQPGTRVVLSGDEEILNPSSAPFIREAARNAAAVFVLEPPLPGGELKTERKGYALARFDVQGRAAHAGIEPDQGVSAAVEAAHLTLATQQLGRPQVGTTVNVGVLRSGDRANVVPQDAQLLLEVRAQQSSEITRVLDRLAAEVPRLDGATYQLSILGRRCPMPRVPATALLFALASDIAAALGLSLAEGSTGGVSEGNIAQSVGAPTLDGLGLVGKGPHTRHESVRLDSLEVRGGLLAGLLTAITGAAEEELRALSAAAGPPACA